MNSQNNLSKGKAVLRPGVKIPGPVTTSSTDHYRQNMQVLHFGGEKIKFGGQELVTYPTSNISFRPQEHLKNLLNKEQICLLDNLWIAFNKEPKDRKYFLACLNSLSDYFTQKQNFKFYVVFQGLQSGVYATWLEVVDQIKGVRNPLFRGFNLFQEALDQARFKLGPNFYITHCLRNFQEPLKYTTGRDQKDRIIFCEYCEVIGRTIKHLNENVLALIIKKA